MEFNIMGKTIHITEETRKEISELNGQEVTKEDIEFYILTGFAATEDSQLEAIVAANSEEEIEKRVAEMAHEERSMYDWQSRD